MHNTNHITTNQVPNCTDVMFYRGKLHYTFKFTFKRFYFLYLHCRVKVKIGYKY